MSMTVTETKEGAQTPSLSPFAAPVPALILPPANTNTEKGKTRQATLGKEKGQKMDEGISITISSGKKNLQRKNEKHGSGESIYRTLSSQLRID